MHIEQDFATSATLHNHLATSERRRTLVTLIHADLVFQVCISFLRCFRTPAAPTRKILVNWNATQSCPFMASNYANSYLVPISF